LLCVKKNFSSNSVHLFVGVNVSETSLQARIVFFVIHPPKASCAFKEKKRKKENCFLFFFFFQKHIMSTFEVILKLASTWGFSSKGLLFIF